MKKIEEEISYSYIRLFIYFIVILTILIDFILVNTIKIDETLIIEKTAQVILPMYVEILKPEPIEKILYIATTILVPGITFLLYTIICFFKKIYKRKYLIFMELENFLKKIDWIIIIFIFILCFWGDSLAFINKHFFLSIKNSILFLIIFFIFYIYFVKNKRKANYIFLFTIYILILLICIFSAYIMILSKDNPYLLSHHYNAYIESIVAVINGKTLFINHFNQYGFYSYFFLVFFKLFDFNIMNFSILMFLMLFIANVANFWTLSLIIKNKIIKLLIFLNILFFSMFYTYYLFEGIDYYYQYFPHRYFFPSIIILLFVLYMKNKDKKAKSNLCFCLLILITSISIIWNIDTGLISYISCFMGTLYFSICNKKIFKQKVFFESIIYFFIVPMLTLIILQSITYIRVNSFIKITELFLFIKFFYNSGFAMLPMKIPHTWMLISLIYMIGIIVSTINISKRICNKKYEKKHVQQINTFIFFISVIGIGLFIYYQGRSHDANLFKVVSYAFIVLGLLMDNYNEIFRNKNNRSLLIIMSILFIIPISFLLDMSKITKIIKLKNIENNKKISDNEIEEIKKYLKINEDIIILSGINNESYISMSLKRSNAISNSSLVELFYKKDYNEFLEKLFDNKDKKILLDREFPYVTDTYVDLWFLEKYKIIFNGEKYILLERDTNSKEKRIEEIFEKNIITDYKNDSLVNYLWLKNGTLFGDLNKNNLYYVSNKNRKNYIKYLGKAVKIDYPQEFTIELIVQPESNIKDIPNATIIGDHNDFMGFVIMRDNHRANTYIITYGSGEAWMTTDSFRLKDNQKQYLCVIFNKNKVSVFIDGNIVVENQFKNTFKDSGMPTYVGDWQGYDRTFNGEIPELVITNRVLTPDEITKNWLELKKSLMAE